MYIVIFLKMRIFRIDKNIGNKPLNFLNIFR